MRRFYDFMISISTAASAFSVAVFLNYLMRYYPGTQRFVVVLLLLVLSTLGLSIYLPKYRIVGISLLISFSMGVMVAWLT